jgi:MFS family permease
MSLFSDAPARFSGDRQAATLALLAFAMLIVSLDQYIVVVALPEIGRELAFSAQTLQSVISAYAVASAGFLLLGGRAADLLGRRRVFVAGLALYASASLVGGLAAEPELLLVARAVQGLGGALVFPATLSLVNTTFAEGHERNRAVAVWGGAGAAGLVIGVLLGGVLTQALGWEAVFFVNVPLASSAVLLAFALIPADGRRERDRSFDLPGALTATAGITLLVFALVQGPKLGWGSPAPSRSRSCSGRRSARCSTSSRSTSRRCAATTPWRLASGSCSRPRSSWPARRSRGGWRRASGCDPRWSSRWPSERWARWHSASRCRRTAPTPP